MSTNKNIFEPELRKPLTRAELNWLQPKMEAFRLFAEDQRKQLDVYMSQHLAGDITTDTLEDIYSDYSTEYNDYLDFIELCENLAHDTYESIVNSIGEMTVSQAYTLESDTFSEEEKLNFTEQYNRSMELYTEIALIKWKDMYGFNK